MAKKGMKRVKKERMFTDKSGYMVVEEYSSYEEADPQEKNVATPVPKQK